MKQRLLIFLSLGLFTVQGWAAPIDESAARTIVQEFITSVNGRSLNSTPAPSGNSLQLVHAEMSSVNLMQNAYYIYNTGGGFVIVSGDDRAEQILGYGDRNFDMNNIPCGLQVMLKSYKEQIDYLFEHPGLVVETSSSSNSPMLTASSVPPLLATDWGQSKPFFNQCPSYNGSLCVTGCSCTSLSQVMYYWKHPTTAVPSLPSYSYNTWMGNVAVSNTVPALPSRSFDWANMLDSYNYYNVEDAYNSTQADAVAWLMRYVGQAESMAYTPGSSGASTSDILRAAKMFGYNFNAHWVFREDYTSSQWASMIQTELRAGRPLVYCASDTVGVGGGHAFNLDGYNASTNKYHINWGWDGFYNDYIALEAFDPPGNVHYNCGHEFIVGLKPQQSPSDVGPEIEITPSSLSFSAEVGKTDSDIFVVTGYNLTGNLTVTLNNGGSIYSIYKTSITKSDATYGVYVWVDYKPTKVGTSNASVTISGGGAASKTVNLSGTATGPLISVSPPSLSMEALVGNTTTQTIRVQGSDLRSDLTLTLNDTSGIFSIDKSTIIREEAINGVDVTVTCTPKKGWRHGYLTINGDGAEPVSVGLTGHGLHPFIYAAPTNISFESLVGDTITKTFTVIGSDLISDIMLQLDDTSCCYSIDYTKIKSKESEDDGVDVTVTYCPKTRGPSRANVILTSRSADTKIVELDGIAKQPTVSVTPEYLSFNASVGDTVMQTFRLQGYDLRGMLTLQLDDESDCFSIDKTYKWVEQDGTVDLDVTVTYCPTKAGRSNASVTISGGRAEAKTVTLEGYAVNPGIHEITTDVSEVNFDPTYTGYQTSRTILVTATNLLSDLQLSLTHDYTNSFGLSKNTITPEAAAGGVPVTVYFSPITGGGKHATLNIKSDGVETVSILLYGTGIKSDGYITAWPSTLSFETQVGTPVTQTFKVTYSSANGNGGVVMISSVGCGGDMALDSESGDEGSLLNLNTANNLSNITQTVIPFDGTNSIWRPTWRPKIIIDSLPLVLVKSLVLELSGYDCFEITPKRIRLSSVPCSEYVTVTYHPECVGEHDANINIKMSLFGGSARPFIVTLHGTATAPLNAPAYDNEGNDLMITRSGSSINTLVNDMSMKDVRIFAEGLNIIIDSPEAEKAIISDIAGHAWKVNLQAGHNEIPVNASGVYIVRIREKTTKLMLK